MPRVYIIEPPRNFSTVAKAAFKALDGTLCVVDGKYVLTDEQGDVNEPRYTADSLQALESWLLTSAAEWIKMALEENGEMFSALDANLRLFP